MGVWFPLGVVLVRCVQVLEGEVTEVILTLMYWMAGVIALYIVLSEWRNK